MIEDVFARATVSDTAQAPSDGAQRADTLMRSIAWGCAFLVTVLAAYLVLEIGVQALPAIDRFGLDFITDTTWDTVEDVYGALPEFWGTLYTSFIALVLGGVFGIWIALFITQGFVNPRIAASFRVVIELLAARVRPLHDVDSRSILQPSVTQRLKGAGLWWKRSADPGTR